MLCPRRSDGTHHSASSDWALDVVDSKKASQASQKLKEIVRVMMAWEEAWGHGAFI